MPFIFEKIDQKRALVLMEKARQPIYQFQLTQVIDRDRDLIFVSLGGHGNQPPGRGECPTFYNLLWQGRAVAFEGYDQLQTHQGMTTVTVQISAFYVPLALQDIVEEVKQAIVEAIEAHWSGRFGQFIAAQVSFPAMQLY
jgi:hypothetical protein